MKSQVVVLIMNKKKISTPLDYKFSCEEWTPEYLIIKIRRMKKTKKNISKLIKIYLKKIKQKKIILKLMIIDDKKLLL